MKIIICHTISLFISSLLFFSTPAYALFDWFGDDENDEDIMWSTGINKYIKYSKQDNLKFGQNEHPVELNEKNIELSLKALVVKDDDFLASDEATRPVFTVQQIKLLSEQLVKGLRDAKPEQDIIFSLESINVNALKMVSKKYTVGRIFYTGGKLNIIIGEHNFYRSDALEKEIDPSGRGSVQYNFNLGKRTKASKAFKGIPINVTGINNKSLNKVRHDWFVIDLKIAAEAYIAEINKLENPETKYDKQLEVETAKLAKQRREMRAEMARMRKEVKDISSKESSSAKSIEERIATLEQLLTKKLITQDEYDAKREKILNDI